MSELGVTEEKGQNLFKSQYIISKELRDIKDLDSVRVYERGELKQENFD